MPFCSYQKPCSQFQSIERDGIPLSGHTEAWKMQQRWGSIGGRILPFQGITWLSFERSGQGSLSLSLYLPLTTIFDLVQGCSQGMSLSLGNYGPFLPIPDTPASSESQAVLHFSPGIILLSQWQSGGHLHIGGASGVGVSGGRLLGSHVAPRQRW